LAIVFFRLLPPAAGADHIQSAVAIHVRDAEAVREPLRARHFLAGLTLNADGVHLPKLRRVFAGPEPRHLPLVFLALRLPTHHQHALAGAEEIDVLRRFVAGTVPDHVLFPVPLLALRILVPVARRAGETNDDIIRPAVAVDVVRPAAE